MKGLFLFGAMCDITVWDEVRPRLNAPALFLSYPHSVTRTAQNADSVAQWAASACKGERFDFIVGHSMGGYVALRLAAMLERPPEKIILLESNPVPSGPFYRNLMTDAHMALLGGRVRQMLDGERPYYADALLSSLRDGFDDTGRVLSFPGEVHALYGDRGRPDAPQAMSDLQLTQPALKKMQISFIPDSCHLPMLENSAALSEKINQITD